MKTVLFVPGYQEDMKSRDYASTIRMIKAKGYNVRYVPINWKRTTIDHWVDELMTIYDEYDPKNTILAGFSFGAMTAFIGATKRNPSELWLFSLSGYFSEDIRSKDMKKSWLRNLGHRRVSAFEKLDYKKLAKEIKCKTLLFVGDIEIKIWPTMKHRTNEAPKFINNSELTVIENVGHDVADVRYITAVKKLI
jgi:pimeloyl-ACP methyl ester carboxylesterase